MIKTTIDFLKYAFESNNPIIIVIATLFAATVFFGVTKKFISTDFVRNARETREQLKLVNDTLSNECDRLKRRNDELEIKIEELNHVIEQLRVDIQIIRENHE